MTKKEIIYSKINEHGENLNAIFQTKYTNVELCKKLLRIERKAHHATTCLLNTNTLHLLELNRFTGYDVDQATEEQQDLFFDKIRASVYKILGEKSKEAVFVNFDARGYCLKFTPEFCEGKKIYQDLGGNGILAPDFN